MVESDSLEGQETAESNSTPQNQNGKLCMSLIFYRDKYVKSVYVQTCIMFMKSNHVGQVRQKPKCLTLRCPTQRGVGIIELFKAVHSGPPVVSNLEKVSWHSSFNKDSHPNLS